MPEETEHISVHTRKRYRVVLEGFDPETETAGSFAIKMSMRLRVPLPRIQHVLAQLPYTVKRGLSAAQANRLKTAIEELGGRVRLETHLVTPDCASTAEELVEPADAAGPADGATADVGGRIRCPDCGWEEASTAEFCTICLRRFRNEGSRGPSLGARIPHDNPLGAKTFRPDDPAPANAGAPGWAEIFARYRPWILAGGAAVLLLLAILIK